MLQHAFNDVLVLEERPEPAARRMQAVDDLRHGEVLGERVVAMVRGAGAGHASGH